MGSRMGLEQVLALAMPLLIALLAISLQARLSSDDEHQRLTAELNHQTSVIDQQLSQLKTSARAFAQHSGVAADLKQANAGDRPDSQYISTYQLIADSLGARRISLLNNKYETVYELGSNAQELELASNLNHDYALASAARIATQLRDATISDYVSNLDQFVFVAPVTEGADILGYVGIAFGADRVLTELSVDHSFEFIVEQKTLENDTSARIRSSSNAHVSNQFLESIRTGGEDRIPQSADGTEWIIATASIPESRINITFLKPTDALKDDQREFSLTLLATASIASVLLVLITRRRNGHDETTPLMPISADAAQTEPGLASRSSLDDKSQQPPEPSTSIANHLSQIPVLANMQDGYLRLDGKRIIVDANQAAVEMFDCKARSELIGKPSQSLYARSSEADLMSTYLLQGVQIKDVLLQAMSRSGKTFWVEISATPIASPSGNKPELDVFVRDVTGHIEMEQSLSDARMKAERSAGGRAQFLATMSHEMRTPMNAIIGLSHLALRTDLDDRQRDYISKIHDAGTGLLGIINDVLDMAKIEAGKIEIDERETSIELILQRVANLLSPQLINKNLELTFRLAVDMPAMVITDPLRLHQVLLNLLSNAVKFTESGEVTVDVNCVNATNDLMTIYFAVSDSGIGISEEQAEGLFEEFNQGGLSTSQGFGGTGLGLSISKAIVEALGGTISATGTPGVGTTFTFSISAKQCAAGSETILPETPIGINRVLVVDDNKTARDNLSAMINHHVGHVDSAASGEEALRLIEKARDPYDCVFIDWKMSGIDGIETGCRIQQLTLSKQPTIVMMASYSASQLQDAARSTQLTCSAFITKPLIPTELLKTLENLGKPDRRTSAPHEKQSLSADQDLSGVQVLLVEDNEINQQLGEELLKSANASVTCAPHGQAAIDILSSGANIDVVLMDIQMPVLDGIEATRILRQDSRWNDLPIIALTANAMISDKEAYERAGMQTCVTKPIDPEQLIKAVAFWRNGIIAASGSEIETTAPATAQELPTTPSLISGFPAMPGIDIEQAIRRVAGKTDIYARLLRKALENHSNCPAHIRELLAEGHKESARREAHSMKSISGNLGASELFDAALELEQTIKNDLPSEESLDRFEASLNNAFSAIREGLREYDQEQGSAPKQDTNADAAVVLGVIRKILELLAQDDMAASGLAYDNRAALEDALGVDTIKTLLQYIDAFDFEPARDYLAKACSQLDLSQ